MLTRLLYDKHAVELALIDSIIINSQMPNMRPHPAYFWAYELYYSGFFTDLINLIWRIYYDFYVVSNIEFETYLEEYLDYNYFSSTPKGLGIIIRNMLNLIPTFDVYLAIQGWTFTEHDPELEHTLSCIAFLPNDQAIEAVVKYVNVAPHNIAGFIETVKYGPHTAKVGIQRRLFASCFMYDNISADDEDNDDIFIKSYKNESMYEFDFALVPSSKALSKFRKYDLAAHVTIKELNPSVSATSQDWINACMHTPFWKQQFMAVGATFQYNEVIWPSEQAMAAFMTSWGGIDPEEYQTNAQTAHFYVNTEKEHEAALIKLIHTATTAGNSIFTADSDIKPIRSIKRIKRPELRFKPINPVEPVTSLSATIEAILGEEHKDELGWCMQILSRYDLTPESFAGVKYKNLKKFISKQLKELP